MKTYSIRAVPVVSLILSLGVVGCGLFHSHYPYEAPPGSYCGTALMPDGTPLPAQTPSPAHDRFEVAEEQGFVDAAHMPLSTFSVDVNSAAYTYARMCLNSGVMPSPASVRLEEFLNHFDYAYPAPAGDSPLGVNLEVSDCPWSTGHKLARVGLKAMTVAEDNRPGCNLVLLVDTSGSMSDENRLPLVKRSFIRLLDKLDERDSVGIVTYAGTSGVAAEPTRCDAAGKKRLKKVLSALSAGGSTHGSGGLIHAYQLARTNLKPGGVNRVVLATDGDFNVGTTDTTELVDLAQREAGQNVYLTVLGVGCGNLNGELMKRLSVKANGNHYYIDNSNEADRILGRKLTGTLIPVAKDVKIQVDFNPAQVAAYRLLGYDLRRMANEDFNDDKKDAGEVGSGQSVTALYELIPAGGAGAPVTDDSRYVQVSTKSNSADWFIVKVRHQPVSGGASRLLEKPFSGSAVPLASASADHRFAVAVAEAGLLLRQSSHRGAANYDQVISRARASAGDDEAREEFVSLMKKAKSLSARADSARD